MTYLKRSLDDATRQTLRYSLSHPPTCDFCGDEHPMFVYASHRMSTGIFTQCWRWCACWSCSDSIDRGEWDLLEACMSIRLRKDTHNDLPMLVILNAVRKALQEFHTYCVRE